MITFTRAPLVAPGDKITSTQHNAQARAMNDRLRSGVGDPTRRIHWYLINGLVRQVRLPDGDSEIANWPASDEWSKIYALLDPRKYNVEWPVASPGSAEGANLANFLMAFVFGNAPAWQLGQEQDAKSADPFTIGRLGEVGTAPAGTPGAM